MRRGSVKEYAKAVRERYQGACRKEKGRILDEFIQVTGYHRKAAIRLLGQEEKEPPAQRPGRPKGYGAEVTSALKGAWEATDRLCSKRRQPFLPELVQVLQNRGALRLKAEVAEQVCQLRASTLDRLLKPYRQLGARRPLSTTKPGSLLKAAIPIRTFADWAEDRPGFLEVELVAHGAEGTEGFYRKTLSPVDVATGWVACQGVWGKGQQRGGNAVQHISRGLPFPRLGLDSANGSEFINQYLYPYCQREGIPFTRSRPDKKKDSAHLEQKNCSVIRRLVGYDR